jgi:hypothetical protein
LGVQHRHSHTPQASRLLDEGKLDSDIKVFEEPPVAGRISMDVTALLRPSIFARKYAIQRLSGDQTGLSKYWPSTAGTSFRGASPLSPDTQISFPWRDVPLKKTMDFPSGEIAGEDASWRSLFGEASPRTATVQMLVPSEAVGLRVISSFPPSGNQRISQICVVGKSAGREIGRVSPESTERTKRPV